MLDGHVATRDLLSRKKETRVLADVGAELTMSGCLAASTASSECPPSHAGIQSTIARSHAGGSGRSRGSSGGVT